MHLAEFATSLRTLGSYRAVRAAAARIGAVGDQVVSDAASSPSSAFTDGPHRAAARAMLKAIGFDDAALSKPLVGHREHVDRDWPLQLPPARAGRGRAAKASARRAARRSSSTPSRSPTASRWAPRACAPRWCRREVIADSIELVARGHGLDALVMLCGCDKTIPGGVMALARLDMPGTVLYGGSIEAGPPRGKGVDGPGRVRGRRRARRPAASTRRS